jgi:hypothetical protein
MARVHRIQIPAGRAGTDGLARALHGTGKRRKTGLRLTQQIKGNPPRRAGAKPRQPAQKPDKLLYLLPTHPGALSRGQT